MKNEQVSENEAELKSVPATPSVPGAPQDTKNLDAENISRELTELITKAKEAKEQTGTITQIISGGFIGISIVFIVTMAQMKLSFSLDTALVLFSLCIPIFALQFVLSSFKIENYSGNRRHFENLMFLLPLSYIFAFFSIFLFILHVIHIAAIFFILSPILILAYLFLIARIQKWIRKWKSKRTPAPSTASPSSMQTPITPPSPPHFQ